MSSKKFSFGSLIFFAISCIVGAGVFLSTAKSYQVGSYHVIWIVLVAAVIAGVMALCFAEMGGRFEKTGGVYLYAKEAFGKGFAFNIGLIRFIIITLSLSTEAVAIPTLLKDFNPMFGEAQWVFALSFIFIAFLFFVNYRGVASSSMSAIIIEVIVIGTIIIFILTGIFHISPDNYVSTIPDAFGQPGGSLNLHLFSKTLILLFYSFLGFENIGTGAQDVENPTKVIPRVIKITMAILSVVYFLTYLALVGVLGPKLMSINNGIGAAASTYLGQGALIFVTVVCIIAIIGIGLSQMFSGARSFAPMSEDGFFNSNFSKPNQNGIPVRALLATAIIAFLLVVLGQFVSSDVFALLVACTTIGRLLQYITVSIGILRLRKTQGQPIGYRLSGAPFLVSLAVIVSIFVIFSADLKAFEGILALIIIVAIIYFAYSKPRAKKITKGNIK
jgi:amino acid transporter